MADLKPEEWIKLSRAEAEEKLREIVQTAVQAREAEIGPDLFPQLKRMILLQMIDVAWKEHLYDLDQLKKGISLRAYAQKDPLIEFQHEAFNLFTAMMNRIREQTVEYLFKVHIAPPPEAGEPAAPFPLRRNRSSPARKRRNRNLKDLLLSRSAPRRRPLVTSPRLVPPAGNGHDRRSVRRRASPQPVTAPQKIGRNDPCFCGSGKKFKKCHGA